MSNIIIVVILFAILVGISLNLLLLVVLLKVRNYRKSYFSMVESLTFADLGFLSMQLLTNIVTYYVIYEGG